MNQQPAAPSRTGRRALIAGAAIIVIALLAGAAYGVWYLFLQPPGPAAVANATLAPVPSNASVKPLGADGITGTWNVDTSIGSFSDFSGSWVGYRVQEQLASIGANTAVGRTPAVTGSLTIAGTSVTAVTITADLTNLQSDDSRRDGQLDRQGIETGTYPTATFTLTSPIDLKTVPADGAEIDVTATGTLLLHGQTKTVQIPLKARLSGSVIEVTGSLPIVWTDYQITKPNSFSVVSIADQGTMELQLFFAKA
jgi:polyisoprenoid-binding protein YceI